jgi:predicted phosphate transport protein (TIGR00153 family)
LASSVGFNKETVVFKLIPKEEKFFDMFISMAQNAHESSKLLTLMMEQPDKIRDTAESIKALEHKGDRMTHDLIVKLNKTFIVPIDREDIYGLSSKLDDVTDLIESIARRLVLFKVTEVSEPALELARILQRSTAAIVIAVTELQNGMRVMDPCIEINRLEDEADHIYHLALAKLFEAEKDPIALIKWKELYEKLEASLDRCEDVANVIEGIIVKNA